MKTSYSCMSSVASIIHGHSQWLIGEQAVESGNCRDNMIGPLEGKFLSTQFVYEAAIVETGDSTWDRRA